MKSSIDELLEHVDEWKLKLHKKLKRMTSLERKAFWEKARTEARELGLRVVDLQNQTKRRPKRTRRTG